MIRQEIAKLIEKSIKEFQGAKKLPSFNRVEGGWRPEIQIEHPGEKIHGDYATNVAMVIAKQIKKSPTEIANILGSRLQVLGDRIFEKVEVAEPGFINFFISKEYLQKQVAEIMRRKEKFGDLKIGKNQKIQVEFISANPTGLLHLGHGRGAFFGDTLANVLEKAGYKVTREYYINDAKNSSQIKELGKTALGKGITYLTEYLKKKIQNSKSKRSSSERQGGGRVGVQKCQNEGEAGYLLAQEIQKDIKDFIEKKLKIKFDNWVSEEELYQKNKIEKIYNWLKRENLIYKKEGAEWLKTSKFGDNQDWVIIRETGEPTYLLSDIVYHKDKFDRKFGKIINIWGADHQGHVGKIKAVAKMLDYRGDLDILISQVVRLKKGKISKRKGEIITLEWLIDEVGLDPARFIYLMKSLDTQMEFNVELAKERSAKSPVYYVQYAHARICSILRKIPNKIQSPNLKLLKHPSEIALIKELIKFPEIISDTSKDYQAQRLPQYAIDLATSFHQFYRDCKVLTKDYNPPTASEVPFRRAAGGSESHSSLSSERAPKNLRAARLGLILATQTVFKNTLDLMGVSAPEKM